MWIIYMGLSLIFALGAIFLSTKKSKLTNWSMLLSLIFSTIEMYEEYAQISNWVVTNNTAALMDVVPFMPKILLGYVVVIIVLNVIALFIYTFKRAK